MRTFESLWDQLLEHLDREGLLPLHIGKFTPAEIGRYVAQKTGDQRVNTFVWGYFYPKQYGNQQGTITEKRAKALVKSFEKPPTEQAFQIVIEPGNAHESIVAKPKQRCTICRKRWASVEEGLNGG